MYPPPTLTSWRPPLLAENEKSSRNDVFPCLMICGMLPSGPNVKPLKLMIGEPLLMPLEVAAGWFFHGTRDTSWLSTRAKPPFTSFTARVPSTFVNVTSSLSLWRVTCVRRDGCLVGVGRKSASSGWKFRQMLARQGRVIDAENR